MSIEQLPLAEFYRFADAHSNLGLADSCQQLDCFYNEVAEETGAVMSRRRAYLAAVAPELLQENIEGLVHFENSQLHDDPRFPFTADLVHSMSWFKGRKPARIGHYECVIAPASNYSGAYAVVSEEWKCVIERFEPSLHEFFPHVLRFADGDIEGRYIFRKRGYIPDCYVWVSGEKWVRKKQMAGRHWASPYDNAATHQSEGIVSRPLAVELHKLLPTADWFSWLDDSRGDGVPSDFPLTPLPLYPD
jgi:hypothetical protein